jgi:hypothetical protein
VDVRKTNEAEKENAEAILQKEEKEREGRPS